MYNSKLEGEPCGTGRLERLVDHTRALLIYGATFLAWGAVAESQIGAYSISFSFTVVLSLGTSLVTLIALAPQAAASTRISLRSTQGIAIVIQSFKSALEKDARFFLLAICDMMKLVLSLALLATTEHISLWFYMIYSDGQLIFAFKKLKERALLVQHSEDSTLPHSGVQVTRSQLLSFVMFGLANLLSFCVIQNLYANFILAAYLFMSLLDHCVLESGKTHTAVAQNELAEYAQSLLRGQKRRIPSLQIVNQASSDDIEAAGPWTGFDFSKNSTKLVYAGTKLCVSLCLAVVYIILFKIMFTLPYEKTQQKSIAMLMILVLLSIHRDKYEKKIASRYDPSSLHLGRALFTPLIYVTFTVLSLIDQSLTSFLAATAYQLGIFSLYFDNYMAIVTRNETSRDELVTVFNREGNFVLTLPQLLTAIGMLPTQSKLGEQLSAEEQEQTREQMRKRVLSIGFVFKDFLAKCWQKQGSRRMLTFFSLNMIFMLVEMSYGLYANSMGLISDAFHMLSDCFSILVALIATYISSSPVDSLYTYGYERVEVIAGLFNGLFLVFVAFNICCESIKRLYEPAMIEAESLLTVSVLGLAVNIVGLVFFQDHAHAAHAHHRHSNPSQASSATPASQSNGSKHNFQGVFLHVLADTLGSVAVIISSICIQWFGWHVADPICCFVISGLILFYTVPLLKDTIMLLALGTDGHLAQKLTKALLAESFAGHQLTLENIHVWQLAQDDYVCSVKASIEPTQPKEQSLETMETIEVTEAVIQRITRGGYRIRPQHLTCQVTTASL